MTATNGSALRARRATKHEENGHATRSLLAVENVSFSYGQLQVLFDVSIDVPSGSRVALLGTNGAGKSTLLKVAAGVVSPKSGSVRFDGEDVTNVPAHDRCGRGMLLISGGRSIFPGLTVEENLRVGAYKFMRDQKRVDAGLDEIYERFESLKARRLQRAGSLSGGEQQMIAVARALLVRPKLLMIDELSLGLAPLVVADIVRVLEESLLGETTLVLVEQSLNLAAELTERAYFMEKGEIRFDGATTDLLDRGDLARSVFFGDAKR